jgi:hypothetical protein
MKRILSITILLVATVMPSYGQKHEARAKKLRPCDLLFHVADEGNPITDVTPGRIDHVAIVIGPDSVIEAIGKGVVITPLDSLRARKGHHIIGRVRGGIDRKKTIENARSYLGRRYDHLFLAANDDIYCSELVQLSYVDKHGRPLFAPTAMSFHDENGNITDYWKRFYAQHDMDVPEGAPGTNPGEMSQRTNIKITRRMR